MSSRTVIFIALAFVALFLLVAAALVWPQLQPRGLVVNESARRSRIENQPDSAQPENPGRANGAVNKPSVVVSSGRPVDRSTPGIDPSKLAEDEILVRARVSLRGPHGLDLFRMAQREPWTLCIRFVQSAEDYTDHYFDGGLDGRVETAYSRDALPIESNVLSPGTWQARICWNESEAFVPVAAPVLQDRVLDFGALEFDLTAALDPTEWLICGRLLHTSGLPINGFEYLAIRFGGPDEESNWIGVCEDGCFAFSAYEWDKEKPAWLMVGDDEDSQPRRLNAPKIEGRIVDFGDITLDCAAVEIRLANWPAPALRRERHQLGADGELAPLSLWVDLSNYSTDLQVSIEEPDTTCVRFLNPGPYRWTAGHSDDTLAFAEMQGELDLPAGKLTRLEIALAPVHCVLARFKAAGILQQVSIRIFKQNADEDSEELSQESVGNPSLVYAIANAGHTALRVIATARGYKDVSLDIGPNTTECTFEFTEPIQTDTGRLMVLLPSLPAALKDQAFRFAICITRESNGVEQTQDIEHIDRGDAWGEEDTSKLSSNEVGKGPLKVTLRERDPGMGYPGGIVSGPVECVIEPDKLTTVKMPAIDAPPWNVFSRRTCARLTCNKQPISYSGPVWTSETEQNMSLFYDQSIYLPVNTYAIPDGEARIGLEFQMPDEQTGTSVYYHDFPARLEVRVKRGKTLVPMRITARVSQAQGSANISAPSVENGIVRLWAPVGKANIEVEVPGLESLNREVEVKPDLTVLDFEITGTLVQLEWDARYREDGGAAWLLLDGEGRIVRAVSALEATLKLDPGAYSMIPQHLSKPEISFELGAAEDASVTVPYVAPIDFSASMLVRFPKELKPDPDGYFVEWRWYVPSSGDAEKDQRVREYCGDSSWQRVTTEGVKFFGLPVELEFTFVVAIGSLDDNDNLSPIAWTMAPARVRLKADATETIAVDWKRAVVLSESWAEGYEVSWSGGTSPGMVYNEYWRVFLPGAYVLKLVNETGKSFNLNLKLDEGKFFEMPEDVRKARFGEDEPTDGESGGD